MMAIPILGKIIDTVLDKGAGLISEFITDKDQAAALEHAWRSQVSSQDHDIKELELTIEKEIYESHQKTVQAELQQSDLFTKRTRPKIARHSFYAGLLYILMSRLPAGGIAFFSWKLMPWQYDWEILMLLFSPALTYMGVRGFEKWKAGGAK